LKNVLDKIEEGHHAILFLYKADKSCHGKLTEIMENNILQWKDPFLRQLLMHVGYYLVGKTKMAVEITRLTKENDNIAFATTCTEDKKGNEKKRIKCYNCKKMGHYAN